MRRAAVTALRVRHFRSHHKVDLAFDGRPVAIFGANGTGKTNLIEAISMLSPGRGMRRAATDDLVRRPEALGWKIEAELADHEVTTQADPGAGRSVTIDGKAAPQVALGRIARMLWLVPAMDRLWIEGADGRRRFLDRAVMSFDPAHAEAALDYEKAMRERNRLLKDMVRDGHWYTALEARMAEFGAADRGGAAGGDCRTGGSAGRQRLSRRRPDAHAQRPGDAGEHRQLPRGARRSAAP